MPIANCFVRRDSAIELEPDDIVQAWSTASGVGTDEMTINVVPADQGGKAYTVMAWLYLPSLWSDDEVVALGEGLATALANGAAVDTTAIQVITTIVHPGYVIESGTTLYW